MRSWSNVRRIGHNAAQPETLGQTQMDLTRKFALDNRLRTQKAARMLGR